MQDRLAGHKSYGCYSRQWVCFEAVRVILFANLWKIEIMVLEIIFKNVHGIHIFDICLTATVYLVLLRGWFKVIFKSPLSFYCLIKLRCFLATSDMLPGLYLNIKSLISYSWLTCPLYKTHYGSTHCLKTNLFKVLPQLHEPRSKNS